MQLSCCSRVQAQAQLHHTVQFGMQCAIICIGMKLHNNWPKISTFITLVFQNVQCFVHFIIFFSKISDFYRLFLDEFVTEITTFFLRYRLQVAWKPSRFITEPSQFVHCSYDLRSFSRYSRFITEPSQFVHCSYMQLLHSYNVQTG